MSVDDRVFILARAMARYDGHDPDMMGVPVTGRFPPSYRVHGFEMACGERVPLWHLYIGLATVALETIKKLPE